MTTTSYNIYQQLTSVRVATTANLSGNYFNGSLNNGVGATLTALSVGALTVDGVLLEAGDRVLVKNQTATNQNGIYVVQTPGGLSGLWMLERAPDFQSVEQLKVGQYFTVGAGATLAGSMYVLIEPLPDTIGLGNFSFVDVGDTPTGPFLLKAANLSDLVNRETGFTNLGLGSGDFLIIDESDFVAGLYTLTNPCPNLILVNATTPGNAVRLPPVDESQSFIPSQGPVFFIDQGFEGIDVQDSTGAVISPLEAPACEQFVLTSNAFPQGVWFVRSFVSTVNGKSGDVVLSNSNQMIYVSTTGSDTIAADGSILNPYASLSYALSQITTASQTTPFEIVMATGVYNELANVSLKPWVHIEGNNAIVNIAGQLLLDASWGTVVNPRTFVRFINITAAGGALLNRTVYQANSLLFFNAVNFSNTPAISASGSGTNVDAEILAFFYCLPINGSSPVYTLTNLLSVCIGSGFQSGLTVSNTSAVTNNILILENAVPFDGDFTLQTTNTGTLTAILSAVPRLFGNFTVDGTNVQILIDSTSWNFTPAFLNAASISQFVLLSKSDGSNATSYSPSNYTPVGDTTYPVSSVTAYLRGIDNALAGPLGNVIQQQLWVNDADGLDTNSGGINSPFKTYAAAAAFAALSASPTNRYLIRVIGDQSSVSPLLYPYIDLEFTDGTWTVAGGLGLDASWDTVVNNETVTIKGMKLNGFWTFNWIGNTGNVIRFLDCDHSLTTSGNFISNSPALNTLMIINDTAPSPTGYSSDLFITQSNSFLQGVKINNEIRYDLLQNGYNVNHYLYDSQISFGIILKKSVLNTSTQNVYVKNTPMPSGSPVLEDDLSTVIIDYDSYQNTPTLIPPGSYANIQTVGVNAAPIYIYKNSAIGNDNNNGSINSPLATYEAARLLAIARGASSSQPFVIKSIGSETITGNMTLSANISLEGDISYGDGYIVNGDVVIDPNWGSGDAAYTQVRNMYLYLSGGDYLFTFTNPQLFSFLKFVNVSMNTGGFINITGSGDTVSGFRESVTFENCTNDIIDYADGFIAENVDLFLINTDISVGSVTMTASTALATNYNLVINNARFYTNDITVITNNISTLTTRLNACNTSGQTLTINGANNAVIVDASSYMFTVALAGGATLSNLTVPSKTDGMVNTSYSPTSYTPTGDTLYEADTVTGNLRGIDNSLGGKADAIPYQEITTLTHVMSENNEYTANNAAVVSLTLPITAAVGSTIRVNGKGAGGWRIDQQNAGHVIHVGAATTTVGPGGSLASATQYASITLRCITANDVWEAISFCGTFTPV